MGQLTVEQRYKIQTLLDIGFDGIGNQILQLNVGLKVLMLEKWYDKTYKPINSK
jgi:hypothetical protein